VETIFIGIPAFNEEDIHQTIRTALGNATEPSSVHIGIVLHYPKKDFPNISMFPNVNIIYIDQELPLGTSVTRDLAASLYNHETYYLQIDAHTVFKPMWDVVLKANYKQLLQIAEKPIISSYIPFWYRDRVTSQALTMHGTTDFDSYGEPWGLVAKTDPNALGMQEEDKFKIFAYGIEAVNSPAARTPDFSKSNYNEQFLTAGHFLFTSANFLEEVPFDPQITYHEENTTPMRAWTRGYQIFNMKDHALWTREMYTNGKDVPDSWKTSFQKKDADGTSYRDKVIAGTLRNKDILTGKVFGIWGAPDQKSLDRYTEASSIDYKKFYENMYKVVEETGDKYPAAKALYDLEKQRDGRE
jgi:hypothetical protein